MIQFPGGEGKFPGKREVNFSPNSWVPGAATLSITQFAVALQFLAT